MNTQLAVRRLDCSGSVSFCSIMFIIIGSHQFTSYALEIAPSVQELQTQSSIQGIFVHRLIFAVRFARYHQLIEKQEYQDAASDLMAIFVEEVAPTSWWAVVLCDSVQLLSYGKFKKMNGYFFLSDWSSVEISSPDFIIFLGQRVAIVAKVGRNLCWIIARSRWWLSGNLDSRDWREGWKGSTRTTENRPLGSGSLLCPMSCFRCWGKLNLFSTCGHLWPSTLYPWCPLFQRSSS